MSTSANRSVSDYEWTLVYDLLSESAYYNQLKKLHSLLLNSWIRIRIRINQTQTKEEAISLTQTKESWASREQQKPRGSRIRMIRCRMHRKDSSNSSHGLRGNKRPPINKQQRQSSSNSSFPHTERMPNSLSSLWKCCTIKWGRTTKT